MPETVYVTFVVGGKRIVDVEVRAPYSWLVRWQGMTEKEAGNREGIVVG